MRLASHQGHATLIIARLEIRWCVSSTFVFNMTVLAILDLLPFYTNFGIPLSMSTKQLPRIFMGEGNSIPLQYSCLENPVDGGAWKAAVHGVAEGQTQLSDFTFTFPFMYWRRKWQPTPVFLPGESQGLGRLVGCHLWGRRVGHDRSDLATAVAAMTNIQFSDYYLT